MNTQSKDSILSKGWYVEPDDPSKVTISMLLWHYKIVVATLSEPKFHLSKKPILVIGSTLGNLEASKVDMSIDSAINKGKSTMKQ